MGEKTVHRLQEKSKERVGEEPQEAEGLGTEDMLVFRGATWLEQAPGTMRWHLKPERPRAIPRGSS